MEYWHRAEFNGLPKLLNRATHFDPLFIRHENELTDTYYDVNNPDTALEPLLTFFKENPSKFDTLVKEFKVLEDKRLYF